MSRDELTPEAMAEAERRLDEGPAGLDPDRGDELVVTLRGIRDGEETAAGLARRAAPQPEPAEKVSPERAAELHLELAAARARRPRGTDPGRLAEALGGALDAETAAQARATEIAEAQARATEIAEARVRTGGRRMEFCLYCGARQGQGPRGACLCVDLAIEKALSPRTVSFCGGCGRPLAHHPGSQACARSTRLQPLGGAEEPSCSRCGALLSPAFDALHGRVPKGAARPPAGSRGPACPRCDALLTPAAIREEGELAAARAREAKAEALAARLATMRGPERTAEIDRACEEARSERELAAARFRERERAREDAELSLADAPLLCVSCGAPVDQVSVSAELEAVGRIARVAYEAQLKDPKHFGRSLSLDSLVISAAILAARNGR